MIGQLSFSYRIDAWIEPLLQELDEKRTDPLKTQVILVPNSLVKQWLLIEIAKKKGVAMGLKVIEIEQLLPPSIHSLLMAVLIYKELKRSTEPEVVAYLAGRPKKLLDLTEQLASLFFTYGQFGKALFEKSPSNWQERLLHKLFSQGPFRLPVQMKSGSNEPLICFGIDFLPPVYWDFLFQSPSLSIYLFSPCVDFWEDLCSDHERKRVNRGWKKRKASAKGIEELDRYMRQGPRNLANWGKIGRETLKNLDRFELEIDELYPSFEPTSLLNQIQFDLLTFQETQKRAQDNSLKVFLTGSSKLKEIQCLRDEIIRLGIPYSEISVLAPDIEPYVPLIQYVFNETIPYRISGFDAAPQSSFRQGMIRLIELSLGRWSVEEVLTLFETPSFYRKRGWDQEKLELIREWVSEARIQWGIDQKHREKRLALSLSMEGFEDFGSWEKGLDCLLHSIVYFSDLRIDCPLFEEMIEVIESLKKIDFSQEKTLSAWADELELAAAQFLMADPNDEADASCSNSLRQLLENLRNTDESELFPLELIKRFLLAPSFGQIHSTHLHAVRFAPLQEGALLPATALFLIGMDEEGFPREKRGSSLDLLKGAVPDSSDRDRYFFLQALFSAKEFFRISYGHLSAEEGKPVGPSLLVQELLNRLDVKPEIYQGPPHSTPIRLLDWPSAIEPSMPEGELTVSISDLTLLARHPWKFYLAKGVGIYVDRRWEESFSLQKGGALRTSLTKPIEQALAQEEWVPGALGKALQSQVAEKAAEWKKLLAEWGVTPFCLVLRKNCLEAHWEKEKYVVPPIELKWEHLKVSIVGQIEHATQRGLISLNDDSIGGSLKLWPEALIVAIVFNASELLILKNGKIKKIQEAEKGFKAFVEYYFAALKAPSPLLSDWADSLLRKEGGDLEKIIEKGGTFEDPLIDWVFDRGEIPEGKEMAQNWSPFLKKRFEPLIQLYPARGKNHAAV